MKLLYLTLFIFFETCGILKAQQVKITGKITDAEGQPVSFASVYLKNTSKGTSANSDGFYIINADSGTVVLSFRAIGFKPAESTLQTNSGSVLNVILDPEAYTLKAVTIAADREDPAYGIIRQAIRHRKDHLTEINEFSCGVYIKGLQKLVGAPKRFFGRDIEKTLDLDTNRKGILYLSESQSIFSYRRPNQIHEEMISSKVAGRNNAFSFNKASDLDVNFYNNIMLENTLSSRGFISPVADNAMLYYRYKLLGTSLESGQTINKILVTPRRDHDPAFRGIIYITEDSWRIYGTNLYLTKNTGINLLDTLTIEQQFIKVDTSYVPSNVNFRFNGDVLGFKFEGYYLGVYSNYNLRPNFPKGYFNGEILKVTNAVNQKDSAYWSNNRPIPLTQEEKVNYVRKDSVAVRKESKSYLDSLEHVNNKYNISKILLSGYTINNRFDKRYFRLDPLLKALFYNTVEGFGFIYGVTYTKELENRKVYTIRPEVRYGFSNKTLTANLKTYFFYDPLKQASVNVNFGSGIYDLNRYGTMSLRSNSLNALLFEKNFSKFYQKNFINAGTTRELATGLQAAISLEYAKNMNLRNTTDNSFFDYKDREFTSNNPFTPLTETPLFPDYKALTVNATLTYNIHQRFITRPDGKFYQPSKFPQLQLNYRKGIQGALGSDVDYDLIAFELYQERVSTGMWGYFSFVAGAGKFLNHNSVFYPDSKHFRGNNSLTALPDIRKFQFLDFYQYSTDRQYFEAHLEHNFAGLITNKIPLLRKLKLEEVLGGNYLTQPLKKNYKEFYFGLQRLIFRATYGFAYDGSKKVQQGFRISYGF
jgi:hypothetical protein